jgi:hypothetical protein
MTGEKTSVLAQLTATVMAEKKKASSTLTPVAGEERPASVPHHTPAPAMTPSGIPADLPGAFMAGEAMSDASSDLRKYAANLRRYADDLEKVADGIDVVRGVPDAVEAQSKADVEREAALAQKEKERQADEKAKSPDFNSLAKAAQAAAFGWVCPVHGKSVTKTSSKGREFKGCPECTQFER